MRATGGDDMDDFISAPKVKWQSVESAMQNSSQLALAGAYCKRRCPKMARAG